MTRRCDDCLRPLPHTPPEVTACPQTRRWELPLPFDAPPLKDNDRHHWAVKARHTRKLRDASHVIAAHNRLPKNLARVTITLHWRPSTNRRRDQLSIAPTLKPLVDGLVDYGLIADDDTTHAELSCRIEPVSKDARGSALWLSITDRSSE